MVAIGLVWLCSLALALTIVSDLQHKRRLMERRRVWSAAGVWLALLAGVASAQAPKALSVRMDEAFTRSLAKLASRVDALENRIAKIENGIPPIAAAPMTATAATLAPTNCTACQEFAAANPLPSCSAAAPVAAIRRNEWIGTADNWPTAWQSPTRQRWQFRARCSGGNCR